MKLLIETNNQAVNHILEEGKTKKYVIEGVCIQTNIPNGNKRVYPKAAVSPEVKRYIREDIANDRAVGELNHPQDPSINYERVSHKFVSLLESGDNWIGKAVVTQRTPMGSIVAGLMEEGVKMGISTRGVGSTKLTEGVRVVQSDFHLISAGDIVSDPSAPDAYLTNLMENKEWVWANGVLVEQEVEIRSTVNTMAKRKQLNGDGLQKLFNYILSKV